MRKDHKSLLEQIYVGDFLPSEQIMPQDPAYTRTVVKLEEEINAVIERLGDGGRARMDRILALIGDIQHIDLYTTFAFGLRTGMRLIDELFVSDDVLPSDKG